jgi:hydroxypyruvate isomerase
MNGGNATLVKSVPVLYSPSLISSRKIMPKFAANLPMMFNGHPFPQRFAAAAQAGFTAVDYLFP